jgi:hypothetical protein
MREEVEELALISNPGFGLRDTNRPMLWFSVQGLSTDALLCFRGVDALDFVQLHSITDITKLSGKVCVIRSCDNLISFVRMFPS